MKEIRTFDGFLNADDEHNALKAQEYIRLINMRLGTSEDGTTSRLESIRSNALLSNTLPSGTNTVIGAVSDDAEKYIVFFVHNATNQHRIFLYYKDTNTFWTVLSGSDLKFSSSYLIQARIINNILFWTDGLNEPRRVNLGAAIKMNHSGSSPIESDWAFTSITDTLEYSLIRRPPCHTWSLQKGTDGAYVNNFIENESFQFCAQYIYWDGEQSVLSPLSRASKLNASGETYNKITVTLDQDEVIRESVRVLRLVVKAGNAFYVVKEWDKKADSTVFDLHNTGVQPLAFDFYNDVRGETIAPVHAAKYFDSVPLIVGTLEAADNRLFLGDNTEGYDGPTDTSLAVSTSSISGGATSLNKQLIQVRLGGHKSNITNSDRIYFGYSAWYVYLTEILPVGYYALTATEQTTSGTTGMNIPALPAAPVSVAVSGLTFRGATPADVYNAVQPPIYSSNTLQVRNTTKEYTPTANSCSVTGISTVTYNTFKSSSLYQACVQFYDKAMRPVGGIVTRDSLKVNIPARNYAFSTGIGAINWTLDNTNAQTEIPGEAYYYSVGLSKNLRTRFFTQHFDHQSRYAKKDTNGDWDYNDTTFNSNTAGIAMNVFSLNQHNLGYNFEEGDMCILVDNSDNVYTLPVLEQNTDGIIILAPRDIGDMTPGRTFIIELYKPYKPLVQEPFYEMGEIYNITNPGQSTREYATLFGAFAPDAFCLTRNYNAVTYFAEAMCPNDKFYQRWDTDHGRALLAIDSKQIRKKTSVRFSNVYTPGTQNNGLCAFETLNEEILPLEMGAIEKLQLTSKAQSEGTVMLAIGQSHTASIYIGETQVTNADTSSYFVKSTGVIGQINILKGGYGTRHPESVIEFRGNVFWFDVRNGCFVAYSLNGLDNISKGETGVFRFSRFTKQWADKFLSLSSSDFTALGSRPFIFGAVDPFHAEIMWTLPRLSGSHPKGALVDFPTVSYPYDTLDYQNKTIVFKRDPSKWMGEFTIPAEMWVSMGSDVYAFKNGSLYRQNAAGSYNTFFGAQYRSAVAFPVNGGNAVKEYLSVQIEASEAPEWTHFRNEVPYEQSSDLTAEEYTLKEGVYTAALLRDRLSPNATGSYDEKLFKGEIMRGKAMLVYLQFNRQNALTWIRLVGVNYNLSTIQ